MGNGTDCACGARADERCPVCQARWCLVCLVFVSAKASGDVLWRGVGCRLCGHEWSLPELSLIHI